MEWQQVWSKDKKQNYYWNRKTNTTQWEKPEGFNQEMAAYDVKESDMLKPKVVETDVHVNPSERYSDSGKSFRQMGYYFDYSQWAEERAQEKMNPQEEQKLTKKQVQRFKKIRKDKKEKKKKQWLLNIH